jgi:putative membrane protein
MIIVVSAFALIVAVVHLLAFLWEVVLLGRRSVYEGIFGIAADDLPAVRLWAFGVGFYNLFLAVGMVIGVVAWLTGAVTVGRALVVYLAAFIALSGLVLFVADRLALGRPRGAGVGGSIAQGVPALITLVLALLTSGSAA